MEDKNMIKSLKKNDEYALEELIKKYTGYVSTVIANQLGSFAETGVIEELTSDVFLALWQNRHKLSTYHLRGWLGTTARNKARDFLRSAELPYETLDDDYSLTFDDNSYGMLESREQSKIIKNALNSMDISDREIIVRYYYYNQKIRQIAAEINANADTIKSRLRRARLKLKSILEEGGYFS